MSKVKKMKSKVNAITAEELANVKKVQSDLQSYLANIGVLEVQKAKAIYHVNLLEKEMDETKKDIEAKYGPVNINLVDGTFVKIEPEAVIE
tara:strand:+ start:862 stop:1134 length:273 start_codon:yes stop_codon:yes gene_type:complete